MTPKQAIEVINKAVLMRESGKLPALPMVERLMAFWSWLRAHNCPIRDAEGETIPLVPNRAQMVLFAIMLCQALAGKPIRIVVLKSRKLGVTTFTECLFTFLAGHYHGQIGVTLAHIAQSTNEIFQIVKRAGSAIRGSDVLEKTVKFPAMDSRVWAYTAGGASVGAGGTPTMLLKSELALWERNKSETSYSASNSVTLSPLTIIVEESTARGRELFWDHYDGARRPDSLFAAVFMPWFYDSTLRMKAHELVVTDEEQEIEERAHVHGLSIPAEAFMWRRHKLLEIGPRVFRQEFPSTPEEAIEGEGDFVLPGLRECIVQSVPFSGGSVPHDACVGGIDFGYNDPTAIGAACYVDQVLWVFDLFRDTGLLTSELVEHIRPGHTYFCDPSALQQRMDLTADLRRAGFDLRETRLVAPERAKGPRERDYVPAEWGMVTTLMRNGRLKILDKVAEQFIIEADNLFWNPQTGVPDTRRGEAWGHFDTLDMLRYMVMGCGRIVPARRPYRVERGPSRREMLRR